MASAAGSLNLALGLGHDDDLPLVSGESRLSLIVRIVFK